MSLKIYSIFFIILFGISSCTKNIDTVKSTSKTPINEGYFSFSNKINLLTYKTNVVLTRDTEKLYPKQFRVELPKGIIHYELVGSTDFCVYYDNRQVVFIKMNLENSKKIDSMYIPMKNELDALIKTKLNSSASKYEISNYAFLEKRKHLIIKKDAATILLYNIKSSNYDDFYNCIKSFSFL